MARKKLDIADINVKIAIAYGIFVIIFLLLYLALTK